LPVYGNPAARRAFPILLGVPRRPDALCSLVATGQAAYQVKRTTTDVVTIRFWVSGQKPFCRAKLATMIKQTVFA
jgi:hypothetical protein